MRRNFKVRTVPGWIITLCATSVILTRRGTLGTDEKYNLPKLYEYEDFNKCRKENPNFQYCVVEAVIQPDHSSELWNNISMITSNSLNFPRDHLERGMCLHNCMQRLNQTMKRSDSTDIDDSQRLYYLSYCTKESLKRLHNLQTSVSIKNCVTWENVNQPLKFSEMAFIALAALITLLVGFATIYDRIGGQPSFWIKAFSLKRNMFRLLNTADQSPNLPFLEGLRIILMMLVLISHSNTSIFISPLTNPESIEMQTNSFLFPFINSINTHVISMFFTIAGMVQSVSFLSAIEKSIEKVKFDFVLRKIFRRLANLLPSYAFMIFYQATLFPRTKTTPIAYKYADYCDRHWWTNLLFINNYVHADEPCMKFGWYLGADFQLFLASTAVMMIIWRFPRTKMLCVFVMIAISLTLPAFIIYKEKLDALLIINLKHVLADNLTYEGYLKNYAPTAVNVGYYFFGVISGLTYRHISKKDGLHPKALPYTTKFITIISPIFVALNAFLIVLPSLSKPSMILALYGTSLKAIWGIANGTLLLYLALKPKSNIATFLAHPKMQILARLSYCIYIAQFSVSYTINSNLSVPITNNASYVIFVTSVISFTSCTCGLLLYMAVQSPCTFLLNRFIDWLLANRRI